MQGSKFQYVRLVTAATSQNASVQQHRALAPAPAKSILHNQTVSVASNQGRIPIQTLQQVIYIWRKVCQTFEGYVINVNSATNNYRHMGSSQKVELWRQPHPLPVICNGIYWISSSVTH